MQPSTITQSLRFIVVVAVLFGLLPFALYAEHDTGDETAAVVQAEVVPEYYGPRIVINVAARELLLFDENDLLIKTYPVAIGMGRYRTPIGQRYMTQIVWNPWWIPPPDADWAVGAQKTPPGPHNPLGPVKMNLGEAILLHGTNQPKSIGNPTSHGCLRMYSHDAKEVARWLQEKMTSENAPELFETYSQKTGRSFYVNLQVPVPVDVIYDVVEVRDGTLHVYKDIYFKVKDTLKLIEEELTASGYDKEKLNWEFITEQVKLARNKKDISLGLKTLLINAANRES